MFQYKFILFLEDDKMIELLLHYFGLLASAKLYIVFNLRVILVLDYPSLLLMNFVLKVFDDCILFFNLSPGCLIKM